MVDPPPTVEAAGAAYCGGTTDNVRLDLCGGQVVEVGETRIARSKERGKELRRGEDARGLLFLSAIG